MNGKIQRGLGDGKTVSDLVRENAEENAKTSDRAGIWT
jgi:hypothetical protein